MKIELQKQVLLIVWNFNFKSQLIWGYLKYLRRLQAFYKDVFTILLGHKTVDFQASTIKYQTKTVGILNSCTSSCNICAEESISTSIKYSQNAFFSTRYHKTFAPYVFDCTMISVIMTSTLENNAPCKHPVSKSTSHRTFMS